MTKFCVDLTRRGWTGTDADIYAAHVAAYGGNGLGPHCKFFGSGDWNSALQKYQSWTWGKNPNETGPVLCAQEHTDASLDAAIEHFGQRGRYWYAVYEQEVQISIMRGESTPTKYRNVLDAMAARRSANPKHGKYMKIVGCNAGYWVLRHNDQCVAKGCDVPTLYQGTPVDVLSVDNYWIANGGAGYLHAYLDQFGQFAQWANALGKPYAVTEMGLGAGLGPARPQLLQHVVNYLSGAEYEWAGYWEGIDTAGVTNFGLRGHPDAMAVWKAAINS